MKVFSLPFLFAILALGVCAQTFRHFAAYDLGDRILDQKLVDGGRKLIVVGESRTKIWGVGQDKVVAESRWDMAQNPAIDLAAMSPDGSKILDRARTSRVSKGGYVYYDPAPHTESFVLDTETGKRIAKLDRGAVCGFWSRGGEVLVTINKDVCRTPGIWEVKDIELSFWDGKTIEYRGSVKFADLAWYFLSPDGQKLYTTTRSSDCHTDRIDVWNTRTGRPETPLTSQGSGYGFYCTTPYSSPDGTYIAAVGERAKDKARAVLVWKMGDVPAPAVINPGLKITSYELKFSEDERYIAVDSRKTVLVFDTRTGKQEFQIINRRIPDMWLVDNSVFLYYNMSDLYAVKAHNGTPLFRKDLIYKTSTSADSPQSTTTDIDYTYAIPNHRRDLVLTYSNRHINVFDAKNGNTSPSLFGLEPKKDKSLFRKTTDVVLFREDDSTRLFTKAGWAADDIIYVVDGRTISLWKREN